MLSDLKSELKHFYREQEIQYFREFNAKLKAGVIDAHAENYKDICLQQAQSFSDKAAAATLDFVKQYVMEASDTILCAREEGIFDKEEAEIAFKFLKHILIAAEIRNDPEACSPETR